MSATCPACGKVLTVALPAAPAGEIELDWRDPKADRQKYPTLAAVPEQSPAAAATPAFPRMTGCRSFSAKAALAPEAAREQEIRRTPAGNRGKQKLLIAALAASVLLGAVLFVALKWTPNAYYSVEGEEPLRSAIHKHVSRSDPWLACFRERTASPPAQPLFKFRVDSKRDSFQGHGSVEVTVVVALSVLDLEKNTPLAERKIVQTKLSTNDTSMIELTRRNLYDDVDSEIAKKLPLAIDELAAAAAKVGK